MVSEEGAGVCDWHFQFRNQYRRDCDAADAAVADETLRMAGCVHRDRINWVHMAGFVACGVSCARGAQESFGSGACVHPKRSRGEGYTDSLEEPDWLQADLGVHAGQVPDRSGLVAVPVLDAG